MNRRKLLTTAGLGAVSLGVAGCMTTGTPAVIANTVVTDASLIGDGLLSILSSVAATMGVSAPTVATLGTYLAQIKAAAAAIVPGIAAAAAAPSVATIGAALNNVVALLSGYTLPASVTSVLAAARALLPIIETGVGIAIAVGAPASGLTADQARAVLAAAAAH